MSARPVVAEDLHPWTEGAEPVVVRVAPSRTCPTCGGEGQIFTLVRLRPASCDCRGERTFPRLDRCPTCAGRGRIE